MVKRKGTDGDEMDSDHTVPLPIQTFLWRQTSPFIRGKLGKLCEASCVSFERVLVQNILHGLSPALCEAVQSASRWTLIQAALPHIIHCCAAVLEQRKLKNQDQKFDSNETKILYTLHWIILDAASECEDMENEKAPKNRVHQSYNFSIETIQLFVYMFASLMKTIREPDLQTLKLENGLRLWQPLWDFRQPAVAAFSAPVKPKRNTLKASRNTMRVNFNTANIYVGKGTSTDNIYLGPESIPASCCSANEPSSPNAPLARLSDICALSTTETQSTSVEIICEVCNQVMLNRNGELSCKCGVRPITQRSGSHPTIKPGSPIDKDYITKQLESVAMQPMRDHPEEDVLSASYFDVAVLRCLFCPQWSEDGIYWGLRYIHQRLLEICDERNQIEYIRERSKSLPTIEIPPPFSPPCSPPPSPPSPTKQHDDDSHLANHQESTSSQHEHRKEPAFKRMRVVELKQMFEGKVKQLCRRESCEQFDMSDSHSNKSYKDESGRSSPEYNHLLNGNVEGSTFQRPNSSLGKVAEHDEDSYEERSESGESGSDIVRRKSMPTLRRVSRNGHQGEDEDEDVEHNSGRRLLLGGKETVGRTVSLKPELLQKPIITITEDSPEPLPCPMGPWMAKRPSVGSERSQRSEGTNQHRPLTLQRSLTDSNISYSETEQLQEVSGSVHYIQKDGQMNYVIILQAVHDVAKQDCSPQVCGVLLNLLNCLLDLDVIEKHKPPKKRDKLGDKEKTWHKLRDEAGEVVGQEEERRAQEKAVKQSNKKTCHNVAMRTIVRVFKSMGCPHGCTGTDAFRGTIGDHLRVQAVTCLTRLHTTNKPQFQHYITRMFIKQPLQEVVDFLHTLLVFCVEPGYNTMSPLNSVSKKGHEAGSSGKTPYANNFGEPMGTANSVDSIIIGHILKPLTTRFVESRKDLNTNDNLILYCDIRQFLNYTKETRGSTFRRVALSGLLEAVNRSQPHEKPHKTAKVIRRTHSITSESGDERENTQTSHVSAASEDCNARSRRSLFRRKTRKPQILPSYGGASDSEILEDTMSLTIEKIIPRVTSMSANEEDPPSGASTPKRKFSKIHIAWKRATKSDQDDDSCCESPPMTAAGHKKGEGHKQTDPKAEGHGQQNATVSPSHNSQGQGRGKARMSFRAAGQATLSLLSARKRIEDGLRNWSRRRLSKRGSMDEDGNQPGSLDPLAMLEPEVVIVREKRLVNSYAVKSGMLRFNFMLDCCQPGSIPDPHLLAALLDLEAPIIARAALLLECAHFVNRCNRGEWPNWMKLNIAGFRHTGLLTSRGQPSGYRRNLLLQRAAGNLFHNWGEALGNRMHELLNEDSADRFTIIHQVKDEGKKRELKMEEDEEDFLDEATVNRTGSDCPYALKMVACQVLLEISTFLRETYQYLPKTKPPRKDTSFERTHSSRRWSSVLGSPGHSERSNSRSSQGDAGQSVGSPSDRKISFAVLGTHERSDSVHSSATSLSMADATVDGKGRRFTAGGKKLLKMRRGSGHNASFGPNRSFKLKREAGSMKRMSSIKSRKVSTQSLRSECSDGADSVEADSAGVLSDNDNQDSPDIPEVQDEQDFSNYMPWIKVVVQLANMSNFICDHHNYCHPNCYERQRRSCARLMRAIRKIYTSDASSQNHSKDEKREDFRKDFLRDKLKRRESMFQPSSPTRRRESTPLLEKIKTDVTLAQARLAAALEGRKEETKPAKPKDEPTIMKYLTTQVQTLSHSIMSIMTKAAPILNDDSFIDMLPVAWELLLESDQELAAAAATVFILASVKAPEQVQEMMILQLQHQHVNQRMNAILRFQVLWRFRYQVWPRMEDGANAFFKVPPPSIDFVLPSPTIGLPNLPIVDPPWMPHFKTKMQEVTINQEESKTFVTATTTRRKQQQEQMHRALLAEEDRRRAARENFHMTSVPIMQQAAYEPALHHASEEHEEVTGGNVSIPVPQLPDRSPISSGTPSYSKNLTAQEELSLNMAARRVSVAPINRQSNVQLRTMSWRNGSMFMPRPTIFEGEEERVEHVHMHHMQLAQHFFPSCICAAALPIIHLLEDLEVNKEGVAVVEVAEKVIWSCMVEDPQLFLRTFLEKFTNKDKREELVFLLRKLLYHIPELPAQTAHTIFNYLVGLIMFYVRSPTEGGQEAIGEALSILHQVVPSVHDIFFKDLKQTLKKEQCDPMLMITANVPSAKKLIVHDPGDTGIPSQCPIHEDTQFSQILEYSLDFFSIPEEECSRYFLVDTKTNQMHNPTSYVRDFYFFRRNFYPEFTMLQMDPEEASKTLQKQAFMLKFVEMGKVTFSLSILQSAPTEQTQNHVSFLQEELLKLPSFPRKALEADFGLWGDQWGKELRGLDMMHKYVWVKLIASMFSSMSSTFTPAGDLPLFLNVLSGAVLLHCQDTAILRVCLATLINASRHFKQVFCTSGYLYIIPTLMKVYSNHQANPVLCGAIEFVFRQFYTLYRKPFMLQMFGSLAPLLHMSEDPNIFDFTKVDTGALFQLLLALEADCEDNLEILDLVDGEKPLLAMDFCYVEDPDTFQVIDAINMCITVIAYACDSVRAMQMLTILEAVLPHYLTHIKKETNKQDNPGAAREELSIIANIAVSMRALIVSCETLTRNFSGPQRHLETVNSNMKPSANHSNHSPQGIYIDEHSEINSHFHYMEEGRRRHVTAEDEAELTLNEFRRPRNSLLCIVSKFFSHSTARIRELRRMVADPTFRVPDLLDHKTQNRLAEVTHTLLKVAPYDPATMRCPGLQHYMLDMLPAIDWSNESARPALNLILRRMERLFSKLYKKPILMRHLDWEAASNLLRAIHKTLMKFNYIAHLPHLKTLISVCVNILLADDTLNMMPGDVHGTAQHRIDTNPNTIKVPPPPAFCSAVVKVTAMQMQALGDHYTLEQICGGVAVFPTPEKTINRLINLILPLCIRMGCGRRDTPKMRPFDISFALTSILNGLIPPHKHIVSTASTATTKTQHLSVTDLGRSSTFSLHNKKPLPRENMLNVAFLGLKIMVVCFERQLTAEWYRIAKYVRDLGHRLLGGIPLWRFLDFVVTVRTPLFLMLQPFIQYRMMKVRCETEQEYFLQHMVHQKLHGFNMPHPKCKGTTLIELAPELRHLKESLATNHMDARPRTPTCQPDRSDSVRKSKFVRSSSIEDILERQMASRLQSLKPLHGSKKYSKVAVSHSSTSESLAKGVNDALDKAVSQESLLTQSSSQSLLTQGPPQNGEAESPVMNRKSSGRITAHEGSRILEKFMRKASIQEDDLPSENVGRDSPSHLQGASTPTKSCEDMSPDRERAGPSIESADFDPRMHRLQRQDAKSRKTFKIKRHRSTIKGNVIRTATVKTPDLRAPAGRTQSSDPPLGSLERLETQPEEPAEGDSGGGSTAQSTIMRINGAPHDPEVIIKPVRPSHTRYLPRSKSHDEGGSDVPVSAGTARGRIARQGARLMRSRSPSTSPSRIQPHSPGTIGNTGGLPGSPQRSSALTQAYVTKCDSVESLGNSEENAALLKPDEKSKSESSLLIYFDDREEEEKDTCV